MVLYEALMQRTIPPDPEQLRQNVLSPEACRLLGISRATLSRLIRKGHLRAFRLPGPQTRYRIDYKDLLRVAAAAGRIR